MADSNAVELAQAYVSLSISTKDMGKQILKGFGGAEKTAAVTGKASGAQYAKAFNAGSATAGEGLEALQKRLASQAKATAATVKTARDSEAAAARKVAIEEAKLAEARSTGKAKASALLAAEDKLQAAQLKLAQATDKTKVAAREMATQQGKATTELKEATDQADKAKKGFARLGDAVTKALDPKGTKGAFKGLSKAAATEGKSAGKQFGGAFSGAAKGFLAAGALLGGLSGAKTILKDAITGASDLGEAGSKVNQIFGKEGAKALDKFAKGSAEKLGQTKLEILDAASTFGTMGKAAGLSGKDLAKFSTGFASLSTDMASFFNTSPAEATEAIGAALRGEAEPIRKYGVLLNEASLKAEAMSLGLLKATKNSEKIKAAQNNAIVAQRKYNEAVKEHGKNSNEALDAESHLAQANSRLAKETKGTIEPLTQQQKTLATQSLIIKQTKDAQGDFAKTSGGLANQQRILAAKVSEAKTALGEGLLPIVTKIVTFFNDKALPAVKKFMGEFKAGEGVGGKFKAVFQTVKDTLTTLGTALQSVGKFVLDNKGLFIGLGIAIAGITALTAAHAAILFVSTGALKAWFMGTKLVSAATKIWAAMQWLINIAMTANPIGLVIAGVVLLVAGIILLYRKSETFRGIILAVWGALKTAFFATIEAIKKAFWAVVGFFKRFGLAVVESWNKLKADAIKVWNGLKKAVLAVVTLVVSGVKTYFSNLKTAIGIIFGAIKTVAMRIWNGLKTAVLAVVALVVSGVKTYFSNMKTAIGIIWTGIKNAAKTAFDLVKKYIVNPIESAVGIIKRVLGAGKGGLQNIFSVAKTAIGNIWDGLKALAKKPIVFIIDTVMNGLIGGFNAVAKTITGKSNTIGRVSAAQFGLSHGGILPGHSKARDGDSIPIMARPGEGWMVSEALQDPYERARFLAMNKAALRGRQSIKRVQQGFDGQGFASGGIVGYRGHRFTQGFAARLQAVNKRHGFGIYQGGFRPSTSYSGTSHAGDAIDAGPVSAALVRAFRAVGIAAWDRTGMGNWAPHIHGVPLPGAGRAGGSGVWQAQDYLRGGNGLGGRDNGAGSGGPNGKGSGFLGAFFDTVKSLVSAFTSKFAGPLGRLKELASSPFGELAKDTAYKVKDEMVTKAKSYFDDPTGYAGGTSSASRGMHWVGERGPELVNFRGGESVRNMDQMGGVLDAAVKRGLAGMTMTATVQGDTVTIMIDRALGSLTGQLGRSNA